MTGRWFSPVSSTNETDCHDITEMLLKVALNTINQTYNSLIGLPNVFSTTWYFGLQTAIHWHKLLLSVMLLVMNFVAPSWISHDCTVVTKYLHLCPLCTLDMSLYSKILFWFRVNQSLFFLLNAACLAEKQ
jgi:hypothetical protein